MMRKRDITYDNVRCYYDVDTKRVKHTPKREKDHMLSKKRERPNVPSDM